MYISVGDHLEQNSLQVMSQGGKCDTVFAPRPRLTGNKLLRNQQSDRMPRQSGGVAFLALSQCVNGYLHLDIPSCMRETIWSYTLQKSDLERSVGMSAGVFDSV